MSEAPNSSDLETRFDHAAAYERWYRTWEESGAFRADPASEKPRFVMVIPPPNVTGALHMGHALNNTIQDIYARYHRMRGYDVLWLPGTDHAGIATQNVVEKTLAKEGKSRDDLGRAAFVARVWEWKKESGGTIVRQLRRLGASCDWSRERFTMDEGLSKAVVEVFVRLHAEGLIYRADRLVNWCTRCRTALSDIEVEHEERKGGFWHVRYPFADGSGEVVIATTRPETMLGDSAVAVHPEDERYAGLVGKELILPLVGRRIRLIADSYVDRTFGTGALKITPAHDPNDWEVGRRHELPVIKAFTDDGRIADSALEGATEDAVAEKYLGRTIMECRHAAVEDLEANGFLVKVDEHLHNVGHCYRCKTVIEPFLTPQWFVNVGPLAKEAIAAVEAEKTRIVPEQWEKTYFEWMRNIRDWCISRQIWWGHQIPAWYCRSCDSANISGDGEKVVLAKGATPIVADKEPSVCPKCGGHDLVRDPDVLDTWFSSALWPFSTLGWPEKTPELAVYYPTSLLVTGFDILFFWVARMMMMGLKFMGEVPFRDVYIHALVRDAEGKKMSKSKGNVIDPLSVIDDHGADAFRFTLAAMCAQGRDIKLDEKRIEGYRNFVTKIWNAARLIRSYSKDASINPQSAIRNPQSEDTWILSRLSRATSAVREHIDAYAIDKASHRIYDFFWHEFCDWYLEIAKARFRAGDPVALETASTVLRQSLRLMHPFMPFVTEELNAKLGGETILDHEPFPEPGAVSELIESHFEELISIISEIRKMRNEFKIPPAQKVRAVLVGESGIEKFRAMIEGLAGVSPLEITLEKPVMTHFAASVVAGIEILIPMEGLIDFGKEKARLKKEIDKCAGHIATIGKRLDDAGYVAQAPPEVVAESRQALADLETRRGKLEELLANL
jgi:valyl-tRNA synthetase